MIRADLDLLKLELFLRLRNNNKIVWKTKAGYTIPINKMSNQHLIHTINMLEEKQEYNDMCEEALSSIGDMEF